MDNIQKVKEKDLEKNIEEAATDEERSAVEEEVTNFETDKAAHDEEKGKMLIERSKSIAELTNAYIGVNRMKIDVVKELNKGGNLYESYLGIESAKTTGKV